MNLPNLHLSKRTKIILLSLLAVALLGGASYGGYRYWQLEREPDSNSVSPSTEEPTPITKPTSDPDWNLYINEEYGFSVEYPAGWEVSEGEISDDSASRRVARDKISFGLAGRAYLTIFAMRTDLGLMSWSREFHELLNSSVKELPLAPNARVAGGIALITYSPPGQAPSEVVTVLEKNGYVFTLEHFTPKNENSLLWDIYEHFLRTFEFKATAHIPDELPDFPMGF